MKCLDKYASIVITYVIILYSTLLRGIMFGLKDHFIASLALVFPLTVIMIQLDYIA